jgi:uncharacterized protein YeeX (DUF496 family)
VESGDNNQEKGKTNKGFAGLSSMVSDVDETINNSPKPPARDASSQNVPPSSRKQKTEKTQSKTHTVKPSTAATGFSLGGKRVIGILIVVVVIVLVYQSENNKTSTAAVYTNPKTSPAQWLEGAGVAPKTSAPRDNHAAIQANQSDTFVPPLPSQTITNARAVSQLVEDKPPAGKNNVLYVSQIQYCLAEDIRLGAAKPNINSYNHTEVDRFNAMVADYNARCGDYRYRKGTLESAKREVNRFQMQLQAEGAARFLQHNTQEKKEYSELENQQDSVNAADTKQTKSPQQSNLDVSKPPVGDNNVLEVEQIQYCLAQDIRLSAAQSKRNNSSQSQTEIFNKMVKDYNSRCVNYRYRENDMNIAKQEVERFRSKLQTEGANSLTQAKSEYEKSKELFK